MKLIVHYQPQLQICQSVTRISGSDQTSDMTRTYWGKFISASARGGLCAGIQGLGPELTVYQCRKILYY